MFDAPARRLLAPVLDRGGAILADAGVPASAVTATGFAAGVGACVAVAERSWHLGLMLWLINRLLDGLDGPVARRHGASERGGFLDIVADFAIYAGFVLAIAVAVPGARLACLALLVAYYLSGTAFLALSSLLERQRNNPDPPRRYRYSDGRSLRFVGGLAEGTETILAYTAFCLFPDHAALIAWVFTAMVAITAVQRTLVGTWLLTPADATPDPISRDTADPVSQRRAPIPAIDRPPSLTQERPA